MDNKNLKIILAVLVFIFICFSCLLYKLNCENNAKRLYRQGSEFLSAGDYSNAYYNFKQVKPISKLYPISLLRQYRCALALGDKKSAQKLLLSLIKEIKNPLLRPYFLYNEANLAADLNIDSAKTQLKKYKYIYENFSDTDFQYASAYKIAKLIQEKNKNEARLKFLEYLSYAPSGKFSKDALEEIKKLNLHFSKDDYETLAKAYFENENYKSALDCYLKTNFSKNWVSIADCYNKLKNTPLEKETILRGLSLKESEVSEKDVSKKLDRYIALTGADKFQVLEGFYLRYEKSYIYPTVIYKLAQASTSIRAIKLYEQVAKSYPDSIWASNALWEVFYYNYKLSRFKTCIEIASHHAQYYKDTQDAPRVMYWLGMAYLNEKKNQQAKEQFIKVTNNYPLSYYAFLSARRLKTSKAKRFILKKPVTSYNIDLINKILFKDKFLLELAQNDDYELIDEFRIKDEYIKSWVLNKKGQYPSSIATAKKEYENPDILTAEEENKKEPQKKNFTDYRLKLIYPILYGELINDYAPNLKQSPYLFLSLVRTESHFDKNAKSSVGALGLAQVLPQTADFVNAKYEKAQKVTKEELLNEETNIRTGLRYFNYLVQNYNGNEYLALAAYNAGPGNVDKWIKKYNYNFDVDEFVEDIPYLETKNYVKKILSSYWAYINIYK